jgi:4-amino-4-deoxy-L-arabinose transferase-like glycosyltransferase
MATSKKLFDWLAVCLLFASAIFWLHGLSNNNLTLWDEAININVVKNLADHSITPMLHRQDFGLDFRGWDNNYIWLHKPLLPFYLNSFLYRLFGETVFSYKLLGLLSALMVIAGFYAIGKKYFTPQTGLLAGLIFAINPYVFALTHEFQFSGFIDLIFAAALMWSLYYLFAIGENPSRKNYLLFAIFGSLAFLCKNGLAYGPYVVAVLLSFRLGIKKTFIHLLYVALLTLVVIAPEMIILARLFPAEFAYEQSQYLRGFVADLEYAGRPWDYYLSFYFSSITGAMLAGLSWVAICYSALKSKASQKHFILFTWIVSYLMILSFEVSKISNYLVPVLLPLCLLISEGTFSLLKQQKYRLLAAYSSALVMFYLAVHFNLLGLKASVYSEQSLLLRFSPFWAYLILLGLAYLVLKLFKNEVKLKTWAYTCLILAAGLILLSYARTDLKSVSQPVSDSLSQAEIRQSAQILEKQLPQNAILLTQTDKIQDNHLYFMYWTGFDSLQIRIYQPIFILAQIVPKNQPVYVVSDTKVQSPEGIPLTYEFSVPFGYVYKLR